jgi:nucleoside-diphosphate-sugar epimerase
MKVFVTGATGFIGAHLVKRLSDEGITVHVLLRSIEKGQYLNFKNVHLFKGDILDLASIEKAIDGCTHVYHIAACTSVWEANPQTYHDINVIGTKNVLDASRKFNISKIVATSTCGVYGPSTNGVITEEKENDRSYFNHYESTKEESEILVKKYIEEYDLDIITVNPTRVYGPNLIGEFNPMTEMINRYVNGKWKFLPGKGDQIGNY